MSITFLFFLSGHAKINDKYLSDSRATYYDTAKSQDPDWKVRQCYMLLIASVLKIFGSLDRQQVIIHMYPNFGQYMPINYFKAFCSAAPFCWSKERYWCECFLPCLSSFNCRRQQLIKTVLMLVDESISGWDP
jgi:hypothetical protein